MAAFLEEIEGWEAVGALSNYGFEVNYGGGDYFLEKVKDGLEIVVFAPGRYGQGPTKGGISPPRDFSDAVEVHVRAVGAPRAAFFLHFPSVKAFQRAMSWLGRSGLR